MCGIAGILNYTTSNLPIQATISKMTDQLKHRGPDDVGTYIDESIGLGHTRLSIIDVNGGHQPIHDEDKDIWIVFNGEVFNYIELRKDLIAKGARFYTNTDTEVIVQLYKKYGLAFVDYLNGQFSIALWDKRFKRLVLARDRVGIAPLFIYKRNNTVCFASEVKALISCMPGSPKLDITSLDQILTFWSPVDSRTLFKDVFEVRPGEMVVYENGTETTHKYWDWDYPLDKIDSYHQNSESDLVEELHDRLIEATRIRLRSDVPVAAYLSGGLDSSALVSLIHHYGNVPLRTFSIGFDDKKHDESKYQKNLINHLGADHSTITCTANDIANCFERTIYHTESTVLRTAPTPMMLLSGLVRDNNYKVVLTGEGADEVFGGYDIFKEAKIRQFWAKNSDSQYRPLLLKRLYPYLDITSNNSRAYLEVFFGTGIKTPDLAYFSHLPRWNTTSKIKSFYSDDLKSNLREEPIEALSRSLPDNIYGWHSFNRGQYIESKTLMSKYLLSSQGDRMLMSNSVEGRFPFLDHNIIEFASKLHPKIKMKVLNEKYILKKSMGRYLPSVITNRHKQPYRAPDIPSFFTGTPPDFVNDLLSEAAIRNNGYFDHKKVAILLKKIKAGRATGYKDNMAFVAILSTQMWHHIFINNYTKF